MGKVTIGLKGLEIGEIQADGGPAMYFRKFGNVSTDSFSFAEAEPGVRNVDVEQSSSPIYVLKTKGRLVLTANIADPDTDLYAYVRGGIVENSPGKKIYSEDDEFVSVEATIRVFPAEGLIFQINRAMISGLIIGGLGKNQELYLQITIESMKPKKAGIKTLQIIELEDNTPENTGIPYTIPFLITS